MVAGADVGVVDCADVGDEVSPPPPPDVVPGGTNWRRSSTSDKPSAL